MRISRLLIGVIVLGSVSVASPAIAIPVTPDTFEDGTTMGWFIPMETPFAPANMATGGPAGAGDAYLQLTATGQPGPAGRLAVLNESQWTGDFIAEGVIAIAMHVNNFGPSEVTLRLLLEDFPATPGPPTNLATTLTDIVVPAGSGWVEVVFDLSLSNLVALFGTTQGALSDVDVLRIFHNPDPDFPGPGIGIPLINVLLGVDNITAITQTIPEPLTVMLMAGGIAAVLRRRAARRL